MACDVCGGSGNYPIHSSQGKMLYEIDCPECDGDGLDEQEAEAAVMAAAEARAAEALQAKYDAAMREMRGAQ